jgi:kynurenine 3-monooxygenase
MKPKEPLVVVGGGLVGSLLSLSLARRGYEVEVYERRPDPRRVSQTSGRSINLAVSARGLHALETVGLEEEVLEIAIPMRGRMIHSMSGNLSFQPYGKDDTESINSISRGALNQLLMDRATKTGKVKIRFAHRLVNLDFEASRLTFHEEGEDGNALVSFRTVFAADGANSVFRKAMSRQTPGFESSETYLEYGYKELTLPATADGSFAMEKNALHIWPRGTFMLIALPNLDGTFTCTLFLPFEGENSFSHLDHPVAINTFFEEFFPDALGKLPDLHEQFFENPTGNMVTVRCSPWNRGGKALLLGDASHAIVPFFGQGMNCGFEDVTLLDERLAQAPSDWDALFSEFSLERKSDADAIADMALENFVEMRDKVGNPRFVLEKEVEKVLQKQFPREYFSRYRLVTFTRVPYHLAFKAGQIEDEILAELCQGIQRAEEVDLLKAGRLISERLTPILSAEL